ncbi:glutamate decarboxylase [Thermococcus onnurineus NA1]|uniref:Probable L-aspartate decarboxylase n=1 Tax=Thermococcus onnurineus (strain NA1) TaxID=523850 RepID=B6YUX2_THEON|nr:MULTISPECIES: tyrosine decarboxylase MfnA [Thermococcus]ACJ17200.1 glutamate decarboxylase [Thermococcus onnurineus NA1]NJE46070.1 tyrosine decarboxylase MfnA [Thermococcus sp. GR7]NJE78294.1 tyrosine decarboxylase MfnA [Thermococcus sp. GR4]NJF22267.1 tyrosine decarboxylase MfnA [Thermococcus sp. GR5]
MFPRKGASEEEVLAELEEKTAEDLTFDSGRILGSMCTYPHPFARKVISLYIDRNLGDPGLHVGSQKIEEEAIQMLSNLLGLEKGYGNIVSGGTEANILAVRAFRNLADVEKPELILPRSAHFSFLKASEMLSVKLVWAELKEDYSVDVNDVERKITDNTIGIVGIAGTTGLGVVDDIPALSDLAIDYGLPLHVDAAFGGFVIPFAKELGYDLPDFDFRLKGVQSITIDPHKMGMVPIPAGGIIFRKKKFLEAISVPAPYLAGGKVWQATITGTRPGANALAVWAMIKHLGFEGYKEVVKGAMELSRWFAGELKKIPGVYLIREPMLNIVSFGTTNLEEVEEKLKRRGWGISAHRGYIRIVMMPHVRREHLEEFLRDLQEIITR